MAKNKQLLSSWSVLGLTLCLTCGFCAVAARFYKLQIIEHRLWKKRADMQQLLRIDLGAKRGTIFGSLTQEGDQSFVPLVQDQSAFHLYVDSKAIPFAYKKELAVFLKDKLLRPFDEIYEELLKNSRFRKLEWNLSIEQKTAIEKEFKKFIKKKKIPKNALFFLSGFKRVYPMGSLAGSLVHTLGVQEGARGPERVATGGLEKKLDHFLKGTSGQLACFRTPKGRLDGTKMVKRPDTGCDVYLTLNPLIQSVAEKQLKIACEKAKAKGGWAIVMDPASGDLLAFAQEPSLNLLDPSSFLNDPIKAPYLNLKALTDPFEPGSIMKPITMLVCLKANRLLKQQGKAPCFFPEEKIACLDGRFPGRKNPIKDVHAYSFLNMNMALQKSSNIYMARAIQKVQAALGDEFYSSELKQTFGFGKKTALSLGSESGGFVPTPHKKTRSGLLEWSTPTPFSLSMGYNLLATSMQMTKVFAMIANGGFEVEPRLIKKIVRKKEGRLDEVIFDQTMSKKMPEQKLDPEDCQRIKYAMQFAVNKGGTAFRAKIPGFTACGKTATTEKLSGGSYSKDKHISTFVGFAPMDKPRFVCLIVIDEPGKFYIEGVGKNQYGGVCAAPSFSVIGQKTLEILGVSPDDPMSLEDEKKSKTYSDLKTCQELFNQWNH